MVVKCLASRYVQIDAKKSLPNWSRRQLRAVLERHTELPIDQRKRLQRLWLPFLLQVLRLLA